MGIFDQKPIDEPIGKRTGKKPASIWTDEQVLTIYKAYKKPEKRIQAFRAIRKALDRIATQKQPPADPFASLLARVKEYAALRADQQKRFTPHPATWFNEERYTYPQALWYDHEDPRYGGNGDGR